MVQDLILKTMKKQNIFLSLLFLFSSYSLFGQSLGWQAEIQTSAQTYFDFSINAEFEDFCQGLTTRFLVQATFPATMPDLAPFLWPEILLPEIQA